MVPREGRAQFLFIPQLSFILYSRYSTLFILPTQIESMLVSINIVDFMDIHVYTSHEYLCLIYHEWITMVIHVL